MRSKGSAATNLPVKFWHRSKRTRSAIPSPRAFRRVALQSTVSWRPKKMVF